MGIALRKYFKNIDDYNEIRKLGQGASGEVYLCEEKGSGARVAVKKIQDVADARDQRSFIREIIVPLKLNINGIVRFIGFRFPEPASAKSGGKPALIITEVMPNGTLESVLKRKFAGHPEPLFDATAHSKAVFGIASTMAQVHEHSSIHRDLKPGNVFMDENWEARIADFGLAKIVTAGVKMTMAIGSPMYMAPELYDDDDAYTFAVDVFAFGVLAYSMFTNQQKFKETDKPLTSPQQLMMKVAKGDRFMRQPGIPDAFWGLIERCWAQAPATRPSFQMIVQELQTSDALVFPGTDLAKYREYQERMKPPPAEEEPVTELHHSGSSPGLKMSSLAVGNRLMNDERMRYLSKSTRMSLGRVDEADDQSLRRYDFTRSSKRTAK
jgi:serine/threonine protein kinase